MAIDMLATTSYSLAHLIVGGVLLAASRHVFLLEVLADKAPALLSRVGADRTRPSPQSCSGVPGEKAPNPN